MAGSSHLTILFRARRLALKNRLRAVPGGRLAILATLLLAGLTLVLGLGHLAAPALMEPPIDVATLRLDQRQPVAGESALEAAFWIGALAAAVLSFRVMELLFRHRDVRVVVGLPLAPHALFADRLVAALGEGLVLALACSVFFVPLLWNGGELTALLAMTLLVCGLVATAALTLGTNIFLGAQYGDPKTRMPGDAYGGQGQIFIYAPGAALGGSVLTFLILQLALGEVLKHGAITNAFYVGIVLAGAVVAVSVVLGLRDFVRSYFRLAAFFNEAESVGFDIGTEYQTSDWQPRRGERLLPAPARPAFRRDALQYGRRYTLVRYLYGLLVLGGIGAMLFLSREAFPPWAVAAVPVALTAIVANVWNRLRAEEMSPAWSRVLPISTRDELVGDAGFALREVLTIALPYALVALAIRGWRFEDWPQAVVTAGAALMLATGVSGALSLFRAFGVPWQRPYVTFLPAVSAVALLAVSVVSLPAGVVAGATLTLGHLFTFRPPRRSTA